VSAFVNVQQQLSVHLPVDVYYHLLSYSVMCVGNYTVSAGLTTSHAGQDHSTIVNTILL